MKKLKVVAVALVLMIAANNASAQMKIGYLRIDDIVGQFPELQKINMDTVGQQFVTDSIIPRLNFIQQEYNRKIALFGDTSLTTQVRAEYLKSAQEDKQELDAADQVIQQVQQYKQQEILRPYYAKAKKAIDAVAKKKAYTHVMSSEAFLVAPDADDLSLAVLAELGIKPPARPTTPTTPRTGN